MSPPGAPDPLQSLLDATWPAAARHPVGRFTLREGRGGGSRVSAATRQPGDAEPTVAEIAEAEAGMRALGQTPLFMIRPWQTGLDATLAAQGYSLLDPVVIYAAATASLATPPPDGMRAFAHWPPLAICRRLWAEAGIGPARLAIMDRVPGPRTAILGRTEDRAVGVAFVACHGQRAMLHALEVAPQARRKGTAAQILRRAAAWAKAEGAAELWLAVTRANDGARALYGKLGMQVVAEYHYRQAPDHLAPEHLAQNRLR